jgi:hypothetical protein
MNEEPTNPENPCGAVAPAEATPARAAPSAETPEKKTIVLTPELAYQLQYEMSGKIPPLDVQIHNYFKDLRQKAEAGDGQAFEELYGSAFFSTSVLNNIDYSTSARTNADYLAALKKIAKPSDQWPVLSSSARAERKANNKFFKDIDLGGKPQVHELSKLKRRQTPELECARLLLAVIHKIRDFMQETNPQVIADLCKEAEPEWPFSISPGYKTRMLPESIMRRCENLPTFSAEEASIEQWWAVANDTLPALWWRRPAALWKEQPAAGR